MGTSFADLTACLELTCLQAIRRRELLRYFNAFAGAESADRGLWDLSKVGSKVALIYNWR